MTLQQQKLLLDIQNAINSIDEHLEGRRIFAEYESNKTKRRAIEREFEIIGEATNNLLKINSELPLSYARTVVNLRNKLIHAYDSIDETIIWKLIIKDLPVLLTEVNDLLNQTEEGNEI